jgi:preprotein translocase subunit YajC
MKLFNSDIRSKIVGLFVIFILLLTGFVFLWVLPRTKQAMMRQK